MRALKKKYGQRSLEKFDNEKLRREGFEENSRAIIKGRRDLKKVMEQ
jgi:hypothetical protein